MEGGGGEKRTPRASLFLSRPWVSNPAPGVGERGAIRVARRGLPKREGGINCVAGASEKIPTMNNLGGLSRIPEHKKTGVENGTVYKYFVCQQLSNGVLRLI